LTGVAFTGERLHAGSGLFGVDLVRHRAAYGFALEQAHESDAKRVLDLGCGSGYGAAELGAALPFVAAVDRVPPDRESRNSGVHFVRADLHGVPIQSQCFDLVSSFQVIEHLEDPSEYLQAIARILRPEGMALLTTPNLQTSDRENPFHVHEYEAGELASCLEGHFGNVEMLGVGASAPVARYHEDRLDQIHRITRLDPLRLRHRLPRSLVEWAFARLAIVVRKGIASGESGMPEVTLEDFPIGPVSPECLDLLAVCRAPRSRA